MRIRDRLLGAIGATPSSAIDELRSELTAALEEKNVALEAKDQELATAKGEVDRQEGLLEYAADALRMHGDKKALEGILDVGGDLDIDLPGFQSQRFFRTVSAQNINGGATESRDLSDVQRERILRASHIAYALQGHGENLLDTHLDFIIGDAIRPESASQNEELQEFLDEIWEDPRSRLDEDHEELTKSLLLEGELVQKAELSTIDGHIESAWCDPLAVQDVVKDRLGRDAFLLVSGPTAGEVLIWFILDSLTDQLQVLPWPEEMPNPRGYKWIIREESMSSEGTSFVVQQRNVHGLCFAWFHNRPKGGKRGRGELQPALDHIDAYDEMIWSTVDVQNLKRLLLLHVKSKQIRTPAEGKKFLKQIGLLTPPKNPKTFATSDNVTIEQIKTEGAESEKWLAQELGISIYGGKGFPGDWRGSQFEQNLAGAKESAMLPLRRLRRKQRTVLRHWKRRIEIEIEFKRRAGIRVPEGTWKVSAMEVGGKDKARGAEVLNTLAKGMLQAESISAVRVELVNHVILTALRDMGIDIPSEFSGVPEELSGVAKQLEDKLAQLLSQKTRTDDGNQDENDRDRSDEGGAAA